MCQFKSFVVTKGKVHCSLKTDSHEDLIEKLGLKDDSRFPNFVRIECVPKDSDVFNHDIKNWCVSVDQDFRPDWFDFDKSSKEIIEIMKEEIFKKQFVIDQQDWKQYKDTKIYVKNSKIKVSHSIVEARENSSVVAWENSSVVAWENSSVEARENSSVVARGNSSVVARENSSVVARGNSSVVAWENSSVVARENSSVVARENSSVVAWENSSVVAWENSSVEARENSSVLITYSKNITIKGVFDLATIKDLSGKPKIITATDFEIVKFGGTEI